MAYQDFTTYTEYDLLGRLEETTTRVTYTGVTTDEVTYLYSDKGVNCFNGNFTHLVDARVTSIATASLCGIWALSNDLSDFETMYAGTGFVVDFYRSDASYVIHLWEFDGGTVYFDSYVGFSIDTTYYFKIVRDEAVGTYGTLYCYIYPTDADRTAGTNIIDTLTLTLHTSKKDFRYVYAFQSRDENNATPVQSGYVENLDLTDIITTSSSTTTTTSTSTTTTSTSTTKTTSTTTTSTSITTTSSSTTTTTTSSSTTTTSTSTSSTTSLSTTTTTLLEDYYPESNYSTGQLILSTLYTCIAQSFTASSSASLSYCKFWLKKVLAPTGNAVAKLYSHSGTYGTSSVPNTLLATSDNFDVSTLTTDYQLKTINFSGANQYSLVSGTYYCISFEFTGGDANNYLYAGVDATSPTHSGNLSRYVSSWAAVSTQDTIFYVYALPSSTTTSTSSTTTSSSTTTTSTSITTTSSSTTTTKSTTTTTTTITTSSSTTTTSSSTITTSTSKTTSSTTTSSSTTTTSSSTTKSTSTTTSITTTSSSTTTTRSTSSTTTSSSTTITTTSSSTTITTTSSSTSSSSSTTTTTTTTTTSSSTTTLPHNLIMGKSSVYPKRGKKIY